MLKQKSSQLLPSCHFFIRISLTWSFLGGGKLVIYLSRFRDDKKSSRARLGLTAHCLITLQGNCGCSCNKKRHWFSSKRNIHMGKSALFVSRSLSLLAVIFNEWLATDCCLQQKSTVRNWTSIHLGRSDHIDVGPSTRVLQPVSQKNGRPFALVRCEKLKSIYSEELTMISKKGWLSFPASICTKKNNESKPT